MSTWDALTEIERLLDHGAVVAAAARISRLDLWALTDSDTLIRQQRAVDEAIDAPSDRLRVVVDQFVRHAQEVAKVGQSVFIVHGGDIELKLDTKNYFREMLGAECVILHEQGGDGGTLIDKFERHASRCSLAVILLSDRDEPGGAFSSPDAPRRPRPNVLFEMGYFFARLGRQGVVLLRRGDVEINSDVLGIEWIDVSSGVESAGERIRRRLPWLTT